MPGTTTGRNAHTVAGPAAPAPHLPAAMRLTRAVANEKIYLWLLVAAAALSTMPLAYWLGLLLTAVFPILSELSALALELPEPLKTSLASLGVAASASGMLLMMSGGLLLPAIVVTMALIAYNKQVKYVTRDLVYGRMALMLIDDQYVQIIEAERRQRFQLSFMPVTPGETLLERVNYFASYYHTFRHLAYHGTANLRPPAAYSRNCWLAGMLSVMTGCLNSCFGMGLFFTFPLVSRVALTWPVQLAIKQACADFLSGKLDYLLERQNLPDAAGRTST